MSFQRQVNVMSRIDIYQFKKYDIATDTLIQSKRWGTLSKIEEIGGIVIRDSKILVDPATINSDTDIVGLTVVDYQPPA